MRPLLGRRALLERLEAERDTRLVTLVGAPGVGKSALLRHWIRELSPRPAHVLAIDPTALARDEAWPSEPTLVWIDDLEPSAAHAATVAAWLRAAPQLRVWISARAPLRLSDEVVVPVPTLEPAETHALLVERVAAAGGATEGLGPLAVALDGLPLVVELIAPHVVALGGAEVLARLDDLLRSLDRAARDVDPRHSSWPRALAPSWDSLAEPERRALAECAAFAGRFTLAAAEAVLTPSTPLAAVVEALCERGLLTHAEARYRCLRPVSAFVRDHAPPTREVLARHAAWALAHASADVADELAAVCARGLAGELPWSSAAEAAVALAHTLAPVELRERWIDTLCATPEASHGGALSPAARTLRARLGAAQGRVRSERGRFEDARTELGRALVHLDALPGCEALAATIEDALCTTCRRLRDFDAARAHGERALALQRASGAPATAELNTLGALASLDLEAGRLDEARAAFEGVRRRARLCGDERAATLAIAYMGHIDHERGHLDVARRTFARVRERFRALGDARLAAVFEGYEGMVAHELGELEEALRLYDEAVRALSAQGAHAFEGLLLACAGAAYADRGALEEAEQCFERAEARVDVSGDPALALVLRAHRLHLMLIHTGAGDPRERACAALRAEASAHLASSDDLRFALRLLEVRVGLRQHEGPELVVSADAFTLVGQPAVSLARRAPLRRLLGALAEARSTRPGAVVSIAELVRAGWGDERILPHSATQRVRVAIAELRALGLREVLLSRDGGYLLDPHLPLRRVAAI
jgi:tetratricopeptide (TPR) repeat protein